MTTALVKEKEGEDLYLLSTPEVWRHIFLYGLSRYRNLFLRLSGCDPDILNVTFLDQNALFEEKMGEIEEMKEKIAILSFYVAQITSKYGPLGKRSKTYFDKISLALESNCHDIPKKLSGIYHLSELRVLDLDAFFNFDKGFGKVVEMVHKRSTEPATTEVATLGELKEGEEIEEHKLILSSDADDKLANGNNDKLSHESPKNGDIKVEAEYLAIENEDKEKNENEKGRFKGLPKHMKRGGDMYRNVFLNFLELLIEMYFIIDQPKLAEEQRKEAFLDGYYYQLHTKNPRKKLRPIPWKNLESLQLGNLFFTSYVGKDDRANRIHSDLTAKVFHTQGETGGVRIIGDIDDDSVKSSISTMFLYWLGEVVVKFGTGKTAENDVEADDQLLRDGPVREDDPNFSLLCNDLSFLSRLKSVRYAGICNYSRFPNSPLPYYSESKPWKGRFHGAQSVFAGRRGNLAMYRRSIMDDGESIMKQDVVDAMALRLPQRMANLEQLILVGHDIAGDSFEEFYPDTFDYPKLRKLILVNSLPHHLNYFLERLNAPLEELYYYDYCDYPAFLDPHYIALNNFFDVQIDFSRLLLQGCHITFIIPMERDYTCNYDFLPPPGLTMADMKFNKALGLMGNAMIHPSSATRLEVPQLHASLQELMSLQKLSYGIPHDTFFGFFRME